MATRGTPAGHQLISEAPSSALGLEWDCSACPHKCVGWHCRATTRNGHSPPSIGILSLEPGHNPQTPTPCEHSYFRDSYGSWALPCPNFQCCLLSWGLRWPMGRAHGRYPFQALLLGTTDLFIWVFRAMESQAQAESYSAKGWG